MDISDTPGLLALALSGLSLWLGWRRDNTTRKLIESVRKASDRDAKRVDRLICHLMNLSRGTD